MTAAGRRPLLLGISAVGYVATMVGFCLLERPGIGIGHFFYIPILLLAVALGPIAGLLGGVLGAALYTAGIFINPHIPSHFEVLQSAIRLTTFSSVGGLVGWFARDNRRLVGKLEQLANRDALTGLPNTRAFESAIDRRLATHAGFVLLVGDVDDLAIVNLEGYEAGDERLRRVGELLWSTRAAGDDVARMGGDEFAVIVDADRDPRRLASELEAHLAACGVETTFGWASHPRDATSALGLYRAAEERLYARKVARGLRRSGQPDPRALLA